MKSDKIATKQLTLTKKIINSRIKSWNFGFTAFYGKKHAASTYFWEWILIFGNLFLFSSFSPLIRMRCKSFFIWKKIITIIFGASIPSIVHCCISNTMIACYSGIQYSRSEEFFLMRRGTGELTIIHIFCEMRILIHSAKCCPNTYSIFKPNALCLNETVWSVRT